MTSTATTQFARRLRELRLARGFARARYFAEALGISENRYTRYERGGAEPEFDLLLQICEILGITPNDLLEVEALAMPVSAPHVAPGFAEAGDDTPDERSDSTGRGNRGKSHATGESVSTPAESSLPADRLGWRLAEQIARAQLGNQGRSDPLEELRRTGELFVDLQSDPFNVVARVLSDPSLSNQDEKVKAKLSREIKRFLRTVGRETGRLQRGRS